MFHPTTAAATKAEVLQLLEAKEGTIRVVLATTALRLGIDIRGLRTVIHLGYLDLLNNIYRKWVVLDETSVLAHPFCSGIGFGAKVQVKT